MLARIKTTTANLDARTKGTSGGDDSSSEESAVRLIATRQRLFHPGVVDELVVLNTSKGYCFSWMQVVFLKIDRPGVGTSEFSREFESINSTKEFSVMSSTREKARGCILSCLDFNLPKYLQMVARE